MSINKTSLRLTVGLAAIFSFGLSAADCTDVPEWSDHYPNAVSGDLVQHADNLYECREWPYSPWCVDPAYVPGTFYGDEAWDHLGTCDVATIPEVDVTSPPFVRSEEDFEVSAEVTDPNDAGIAFVDFYIVDAANQETLIERVLEAPYETTYSGLNAGKYSILVFADDNESNSSVGESNNITVVETELPAIRMLEPLDGERIESGEDITIRAVTTTFNPEDSIAQVDFLIDGEIVGQALEQPYVLVIKGGLADADYKVSTQVTTKLGHQEVSNTSNILVYTPSEVTDTFNPYWTSWGTSDAEMSLLTDKTNTINLAFAQVIDDFTVIGSDSLLQYRGENTPEVVDWVDASYLNWTSKKYHSPETNVVLSFGGATYNAMWDLLKDTNNVESFSNALIDITHEKFPVYLKNDIGSYTKQGYVTLDGVDIDIEPAGMEKDEVWSENIAQTINHYSTNNGDKIIMLTGMHTAGDDPSCQNVSSFEQGCSYPAGTHYAGGLTKVLSSIKDNNIDLTSYQVMAYDAGIQGVDYDWKIALSNLEQYLDADKIILGVSIGEQWGPTGRFIESMETIKAKTLEQQALGYGGVMVWAVGAAEAETAPVQVEQMNEIADTFIED
ncbi:glycosyl hydrolase family 18 protein [Psychromonas ossibalaenae]|uniref:glycosyl hydrolase family 18 protein n=1 Tax=Psychromonas ossibalaenae TaxID=444922 RepID=UPI0003671C11|nr:glycosyl hydrolase family 18 protein [Psychromonas ossibalaenae]